MMSAAALALSSSFIGCKDKDLFDPIANEQAKLAFLNQYRDAFISVFGQPASNQDWGFGDATATSRMTRSGNISSDYTPWPATHEYTDANGKVIAGANMNHNEWADPDKYFGGWIVPDPLTEGQKLRVQKYFQANPNLSYQDPQYVNFFVQQVYTGGTSAPTTGNHESTAAADGTVHAGSTLNQLTVGAACSHINDFNAGTCTASNVLDNGSSVNNGKYHDDQITLMVNVDDTECFGYHETGGSNVKGVINHNDKMALVSAADIDAWAVANGIGGDPVVDKWNRSFMGFDYELLPESDIVMDTYAKLTDVPNWNNIPYVGDGDKVMILGAAPESTETTKNDDFDLMPYFANHVSTNNATCSTVDGKIVCSFGQYYGALTFGQGTQDWTPYSKLVIEFETSTISGTVMNIPFAVGDTKVEVPLNDVKWWGDDQGPTIVSNDGTPSQNGTLIITSVKLIGKTVEGVTVDPSNYYYPTYLLGDNDADKIAFYSTNTNMYGGTIINLTEDDMKTTQDSKTCLNLVKFRQLKNDGYHPISTDLKTWVKWQAACDGYYSDWIVTLTKAERIDGGDNPGDEPGDDPVNPIDPTDPHPTKIRVMAEDLSATEASDFDFNDVVFDAEYVSSNQVKITVWAAGGTLPLRINSYNGVGGFEVHKEFGVDVTCMVNTHAKDAVVEGYSWVDNLPVIEKVITISGGTFSQDNFPLGVRNLIRVEVYKNDDWHELTANKGQVASKIATPVGTQWMIEKKCLNSGYPLFQDYVGYRNNATWYSVWSEKNAAVLYGADGYTTTCNKCQ